MKTDEITIPNPEDIQRLHDEYLALKAEEEAITPKIYDLEKQLRAAESRRSALVSHRYSYGLVQRARDDYNQAVRKANDSRLPVLELSHYGPRVIRKVTDKWISVAYFGQEREQRYNVSNGWLERTRSGYDTIDTAKALELWRQHVVNIPKP